MKHLLLHCVYACVYIYTHTTSTNICVVTAATMTSAHHEVWQQIIKILLSSLGPCQLVFSPANPREVQSQHRSGVTTWMWGCEAGVISGRMVVTTPVPAYLASGPKNSAQLVLFTGTDRAKFSLSSHIKNKKKI